MLSSRLRTLSSVVLYILLFYSIFDVYYTSPLVHGMGYKRPSSPGLVDTVVFIVADGLRYDKLFTGEMENTPTLRSIILNEGSWGYSHTRVPTESRPGHVALFAGFYEDVASITKGWQANAVEFDSIFNRSYHAFAWGGPDVVPMFQPQHRIGDARVKIESYPHVMLDFTAENITLVDDWVVDRFSDFMKTHSYLLLNTNSSQSPEDGFRKGNFIFLHLSAADQMGHTKKPDSEAYTAMVHNLDANIARVLAILKEHPKIAQETAFIFTSDHGMTDWGSHGAGSAHETITPLIVWGKNIPRPMAANWHSHLLPFTHNLSRHHVNQADLCPLVACLLGIPIPANSVILCPIVLVGIAYGLIGQVKESLGSATASPPIHGALYPETTFLMIIANFLAVHFFAMLKDEGSWLDIGESISHYVIAMSIGLASVVLSHLGSWMLVPTWARIHSDRMKFL
ncbi:GPI ethanolamine phosphate transferase 1 [Taenia solium]|eukprot:TsM_000769700 transcript=TsM_000769700 gene=TsM_000769700